MTHPPHEPTRHVLPASVDLGRGDAPPPPPPHGSADAATERHFDSDGEAWIARPSGRGACGTGSYGLGLVDAVHFFRAADPERPVREALVARGRFPFLYETELAALCATATAIPPSDAR